jgi:hypothetical protein
MAIAFEAGYMEKEFRSRQKITPYFFDGSDSKKGWAKPTLF